MKVTSFAVLTLLFLNGSIAYGTIVTETITNVVGDGTLTVRVLSGFGGVSKDIPVNVSAGDTPTTVAAFIASAIGSGASSSGATISFIANENSGLGMGQSLRTNSVSTGRIEFTSSGDEFLILPNNPVVTIGLYSDPDTGNPFLLTDSMMTVGFANGLPPVSLLMKAGLHLQSVLGGPLETALLQAGYQIGATYAVGGAAELQILGNGALPPAGFHVSLTPLNANAETGLIIGVLNPVPEPWSLPVLCLSLVLGMFWYTKKSHSLG